MSGLFAWEYALIGLLFVWGGFVRSGLGFGGAVLTLPFLLLILDKPLVFLPIIGVHLLVFSALTVYLSHRREHSATTVNWPFLKYALLVMAIPKAIGVFGVITLPGNVVSGFIFAIVLLYSVSYIFNRPIRSTSNAVNAVLLALGGYVSGTSLIAAPLVVPVAAGQVPREQLRDTLFALWFILVAVKLAVFLAVGVDMQWIHHLWLLPCAAVGHVIGLRFHDYTLRAETATFFRIIGIGLMAVSLVGMARMFMPAT